MKAAAPSRSLLLTVFLLTTIEFLQAGMLAFAAGPIMGEIGASPEEFSLATASYAAIAIITISKQRWLVERLGWRRYVQFSILVFIAGALVSATSNTFAQFLVGRCVMGLGGASFMTAGRTMINLIPPSPARFIGIKYFATGLAVGIAAAPGLASVVVGHDSWRAIFAILATVALLTLWFATAALPTDLAPRQLRSQSHPVLFMLLASACFATLYIVQRTQYDIYSDALLLAAGIGLAAFAIYYVFKAMHAHERPLINLASLRHPRYLVGVVLFTICYVVLGANNYMLPIFMQRTLGIPWYIVGEAQTLGLAFTLIAWAGMAWMLPRWPAPKKFFVIGFLSLAAFGWQLSQINGSANLWTQILPALASNGLFLMLVLATTAMQTFRDVQHNETVLSHAQQLKNMLGQFGMAMGIALATLNLQWRSTAHYGVLNQRFEAGHPLFLQATQQAVIAMGYGSDPAAHQAQAIAQLSASLLQQSNLLACLDYFSFVAVAGVLGAVLMFLQRLMK